MFCSACGTQLGEGVAFCSGCGVRLDQPLMPQQESPTHQIPTQRQENKRWFWILILPLGLLIWIFQYLQYETSGGNSKHVRVTGTPGLRFDGSCSLTRSGSVNSVEVRGVVPETYNYDAEIVSCAVQKQSAGTLNVEILRGDTIIAQGSASSDYGVVAVAGK